MSRTQRFAQFLRAAVDVKIRKVTEVAKYPHALWFSDLPEDLDEVRSPLITGGWNSDDVRWLVVRRTTEPDLPTPPASCSAWLDGVDLRSPDVPPELLTEGAPKELETETVVPPSEEVRAEWQRYVDSQWNPWAHRARIARLVKPVYQRLFAMHQEMAGREDAYELLIGVGLYHDTRDRTQVVRRHLLAFAAELQLDGKTGTISAVPAGDFEKAKFEYDFLTGANLAAIRPKLDSLEPQLVEVGPALQDRKALGPVVATVVHELSAEADYVDDIRPTDAPIDGIRASFAPALILRPKGARSLEELLHTIERQAAGQESLDGMTLPWRRLLEDADVWNGQPPAAHASGLRPAPERIYFPLPSNDEQSKIVRQTDGGAGVVVQGPPGTGKSHTIANLISHYLATGQRVLVTAQTAQALNVLRDKLPTDLQALCVSLLGAGTASDKDLERSVRGILDRHQQAQDPSLYSRKAEALENTLLQAEVELHRQERLLRDARIAETEEVEPLEGYRSSRAGLARRLNQEASELGWIPDEIELGSSCPALPWEPAVVADYHAALSAPLKEELGRSWFPLPFDTEQAIGLLAEIQRLQALLASCRSEQGLTATLSSITASQAGELLAWLERLLEVERPASDVDVALMREARNAVLHGTAAKWRVLAQEATESLSPITAEVVASIRPVTVSSGRPEAEASRDLQILTDHYNAGGKRRVLWIFTPSVVKATQWLENEVQVEGARIRTPQDVDRAARALNGRRALGTAREVWGGWPIDTSQTPRQQVAALKQRLVSVAGLLNLADERTRLPEATQRWLYSAAPEITTPQLIAAVREYAARLALAEARHQRDILVETVESTASSREVTRQTEGVVTALSAEDAAALKAALDGHAAEGLRRQEYLRYATFLDQIRRGAPRTANEIEAAEGTDGWAERFLLFERAWRHRRAAGWLAVVLSRERIEAVERAARDQRERIQDLTRELTAARAWYFALERIDDGRRSSLVRWTQAVANIPRTGMGVFRRRAVARTFLGKCLDAIPAWVVSLPRLYDTVQAEPGMFDIAIIDEASQCWLDSLVLFYLAKQVVVVGDDKQISPTIVGVAEGEVERLANAFLPDFEHRGMFTLSSSLFDHSRAYLPASVPLREHFRCVPEIIRFSNELAYSDNPLIPLRQCGKDRLEPLKQVFVEDGLRHGDINDREAYRIVETIAACDSDERYEDLQFGVICLQGDAQAKHIERLLLERLGPGVFTERNLRCGDAYAFQGDEREVIFVSMVAAPNANNGTLTGSRFEQRFNVSMSRARDQIWLFHSVREQDVSPNCLRRRVLTFFYQPVDQLIRGVDLNIPSLRLRAERAERSIERPPAPFDSWFEVDVALALVAKGYEVSAQVHVADRRIDLVVEGEGVRLAVECDGDFWHGPEQFDRDTFRQRQLERAGWRFVRLRESLFRSDERQALAEVAAGCEELGIVPGGQTRERPVAVPTGRDQQHGRQVASVGDVSSDVPTPTAAQSTPAPAASQTPLFSERRDGPYTGYGDKGYPDPRAASPADIRAAVLDIVRTDGPLPKAAIYTLYRDGCPGVERAGKTLNTRLTERSASFSAFGAWSSSMKATPGSRARFWCACRSSLMSMSAHVARGRSMAFHYRSSPPSSGSCVRRRRTGQRRQRTCVAKY